jgi:DNA helicase-2/ATP-dependent DNA helicase PcrA
MGILFEMPPAPANDELNPEQRRAVEHGEGPLVVVAGAGTGKTRIIVQRIRRLLETRAELAASGILALTYTRKAAGEMAGRVAKELGERGKGLVATTFHAFAAEILKEVNPALRQIDEVEYWILLRRHIGRLGLVRYRKLAAPGQFLSDFTKFFARCQDDIVTAEEYLEFARRSAAAAGAEREEVEAAERQLEVARAYVESERILQEKNLLTFGGSLMETVKLLERDPARLALLRGRFHFILVDEFQDTNVAQIKLLELLAGNERNLFVVGDDDQAIYRFRGASFGAFRIFEKQFLPPASGGQPAKDSQVLLTRNYRSTKRILKLADVVIRNNGDRNRMFPDKKLATKNEEGERIQITELRGPEEEAEWVAGRIEEEHARGRQWNAFAVLFRKHVHREKLVQALVRRGIPFVIRNLSILSNALVRDLIAALRWVDWPGDNAACSRVLAIPRWGFRAEDLVRLGQRAAKNPRTSLWDALQAGEANAEVAAEGGAAATASGSGPGSARELLALHERLHDLARKQPAVAVFDELAAALGVLPLPQGTSRRAYNCLRNFLKDWEAASERKDLRAFLEYFRYFEQAGGAVNLDEKSTADGTSAGEERSGDAVQLMTVHAAKGLEFDHVFVIRLCRTDFPVPNRRPMFEFPTELMKQELPQGDFHILEERRLFYVALTRARKRLHLTTVRKDRTKPSVFLEDIDQEMSVLAKDVQKLTPAVSLPTEDVEKDRRGTPAAQETGELFGDAGASRYETSRIGEWAGTYRPPVARPLELSASAVESYRACPQKYLFESRWSLRGKPSAALTFGNVMHTTIRYFVKELREGRRLPLEELLTIYDREWKNIGFEDDYQEESYREAGREHLQRFHRRAVTAATDVREQEKGFTVALENDVVLTGRMDQINRLAGGGMEIVDYKTGTPRTEKEAKKDLQLTVYALAAREALEMSVARVAFHYLQNDTVVAMDRTAKDFAEAESLIQEAAAGIRAGHFPAKPGFNCRFCDFRLICPAHERGNAVIAAQPPAGRPEQ